MSGITLTEIASASIPTPATNKATIFMNTATSEPAYKDDAGAVTALKGTNGTNGTNGAAGATGATGGAAQLASIVAASAAIAATETVVVSASLAAGYLTAGKSFRIRAAGVGTTGATPGSDIFRIRIGPTTLTGTIPTTVTALGIASVTAQPFDFEALITLRTSGAGGTIIGECVVQADNVATGRYAVLNSLSTTVASVAVDTTVTNLLELTYISGNAGSSNTFHVAEIEVLSSGAAGGGSAGTLLAYNRYAAATTYSTSSTSFADVDATNMVVTFTAPSSGNVLIRLTGYCDGSATGFGYWDIRESTTNLAIGGAVNRDVDPGGTRTLLMLRTGLTPGNSYTYKWAFAVGAGGTTHRILLGIGGSTLPPAYMEVTVAP